MTKDRSILLFLMNFRVNPCLSSPRTFEAVIPPYKIKIRMHKNSMPLKVIYYDIDMEKTVYDYILTSMLYLVPSGSTELIKIDPSILFRTILVVNSTNLGSVPHFRLIESFPLDNSWLQFLSRRI